MKNAKGGKSKKFYAVITDRKQRKKYYKRG